MIGRDVIAWGPPGWMRDVIVQESKSRKQIIPVASAAYESICSTILVQILPTIRHGGENMGPDPNSFTPNGERLLALDDRTTESIRCSFQ